MRAHPKLVAKLRGFFAMIKAKKILARIRASNVVAQVEAVHSPLLLFRLRQPKHRHETEAMNKKPMSFLTIRRRKLLANAPTVK
jgi:hypothetical protein